MLKSTVIEVNEVSRSGLETEMQRMFSQMKLIDVEFLTKEFLEATGQ